MEKTRIGVLQGCAPCGGCGEPGHPSSWFLSAGFQTLPSCCRSCRNSHAGQAPRACTGRAGPAPAPRGSPALPASTKPAQLSAGPSRAVPFLWLEHQCKTPPLASRPCAGSLLSADTFPPCNKITSHPQATALPGNPNLPLRSQSFLPTPSRSIRSAS